MKDQIEIVKVSHWFFCKQRRLWHRSLMIYHDNITTTSEYGENNVTKLFCDQQKLAASKCDAGGWDDILWSLNGAWIWSLIMNDHHHNVTTTSEYGKNTFTKLFWGQQKLAASKSDARGMRWHPMVIKWCLNLKLHMPRLSDFEEFCITAYMWHKITKLHLLDKANKWFPNNITSSTSSRDQNWGEPTISEVCMSNTQWNEN